MENILKQIEKVALLRKKGWFACFHKQFRVGDFSKDGLSEMFLYDLICKDLHLYPSKRDNPRIVISDADYSKYLVEFVHSIGSDSVIKAFGLDLSFTIKDMEKENE